MGVLTDWQIERDVKIEPFSPAQKRPGLISYGVTSYGYDVRLGYKFKRFRPYPPGASGEAGYVIDPKNFNPEFLEHVDLTPRHKWNQGFYDSDVGPPTQTCDYCGKVRPYSNPNESEGCDKIPNYIIIPPNSFVLGESMEHFTFPRDVMCLVVGKSTNARCGLIVNVTPGEPDWQGVWTIELSNTTPLPMKVYAGEGIMQCVFLRSDARYELGLAACADVLLNRGTPETAKLMERLAMRLPDPATGKLEGTCDKSYADKGGKYQGQGGLTTPRVDGDTVHLTSEELAARVKDQVERGVPFPGSTAEPQCMKERNAAVEVECPKCRCKVSIPTDRVDSYTDRQCPVCKSDMPYLPGRNTVPAPAFPQGKPPGQAELDAHLSNPNAPGPDADKNKPWKSPDGSTWHYSFSSGKWVQATEPRSKP
jgi:dCTP deaminase